MSSTLTIGPAIGWATQNAAPLKFDSKPSKAAFLAVFSNFDQCQPEVADDVQSGVIVERTGSDDPVKFGDSRSNRSRDLRAAHFVVYTKERRRTQVIA